MLNGIGPNTDPLGKPLVTGLQLCSPDHHTLGLAIHPIFNPPYCLLVQYLLQQLFYVHLLREVRVDNNHCSWQPSAKPVISSYQVAQE